MSPDIFNQDRFMALVRFLYSETSLNVYTDFKAISNTVVVIWHRKLIYFDPYTARIPWNGIYRILKRSYAQDSNVSISLFLLKYSWPAAGRGNFLRSNETLMEFFLCLNHTSLSLSPFNNKCLKQRRKLQISTKKKSFFAFSKGSIYKRWRSDKLSWNGTQKFSMRALVTK